MGVATIRRHKGGEHDRAEFENHGKFVPSYHFFAVPVFVINLLWSLYRLKQLGFLSRESLE